MWGGPFFVGAGGDENLKINFLWPKDVLKSNWISKNQHDFWIIKKCI